MGASEYARLTAAVARGAARTGLATVRLLAVRGDPVVRLGLTPDDVPAPQARIPACAQYRAPVSRWAGLSPPRMSPVPSRTSRARTPVPPQVLVPPSTAACTDYGSGLAPDLPHETVRQEAQP